MPWRLYTAHMHYPSHPEGHIKLPLGPASSPLDPMLPTLTENQNIFKSCLRVLFVSDCVCAIHPDPDPVVTEQARPTKKRRAKPRLRTKIFDHEKSLHAKVCICDI